MYSSNSWWRNPSPSCTPNELIEIITKPNNGYYYLPKQPYNEVYPNIYISDGTTAICLQLLRRLGITHVLNASCGKDRQFGLVNTSAEYYRSSGIEFLGIEALDISIYPLYRHFEKAADFIHRGLQHSDGRVLVHCGEGISRSATLVLAYLMIKRRLTAQEAVGKVVRQRSIFPNIGFLRQLCELNDQLIRRLPTHPPSPAKSRMIGGIGGGGGAGGAGDGHHNGGDHHTIKQHIMI
ncbi:dual specificity protein phosphatase 3-like [Oppia nitens]|uniref:dual specificity protein phosphatase 3-like n=1 Tax=Oppia nitens TaxID=1686743 RepID=UPI0023DB8264|nr:dual specificity protein phosphatase 3-like [Oppia nitens]